MLELDPRHWFYEECKEAMEKGLLEGQEKGLQQGLEEGREKGREEGREEGRRASIVLLIRLLESKFGSLPTEAKTRIYEASNEQRDEWALRLLHADSLKAVFA